MADSPLKLALDKLKSLAQALRSSAYFVKRAEVNWLADPWTKYAKNRGISIQLEAAFLDIRHAKENEIEVTVILAAPTPSQATATEIDDGLQDELLADAESLVKDFEAATSGSDHIARLVETEDVAFTEFHSPTFSVQGVIVDLKFTT